MHSAPPDLEDMVRAAERSVGKREKIFEKVGMVAETF